jgi:uncharacterized protein YndB with AHSA1/START domain
MTDAAPTVAGPTKPPLDLRIRWLADEGADPVLRFTCRLDHPVERVWAALTDEDQLAAWYPTRVRMEPRAGGRISFAFPGGTPFTGAVLDADPPSLLVFTTLDDTLRWHLTAAGEGCELTLDNTVPHREHAPYTAAGFDISLRQLATLLDSGAERVERQEMPPPDGLVSHYRAHLAETGA